MTLRWREADSNFQFLGLGRAFLYRLGVTAPFLASLAERVRHRVRRLKPRPTAPACHVDSPIDDFLLPLSARRVRVFMHTRTEVRIRARGGGWLGTEETSLTARVLASCDDVDRRRCLHERCGRWGQIGETRRGTLLPLNGDGTAARRARQVFLFNGRCSGAAK